MVKASLIDNGNEISLTAFVQKLPKKTIKSNLGDNQERQEHDAGHQNYCIKNLLQMPTTQAIKITASRIYYRCHRRASSSLRRF